MSTIRRVCSSWRVFAGAVVGVLLAPPAARATDYCVSSAGRDANSGELAERPMYYHGPKHPNALLVVR
ncbi:MAG: hypothetical protein HY699_25215 [Deltaproteobacteria bacterium]|nr:hypothetical protein [Deltaproteobacteria bacterium]